MADVHYKITSRTIDTSAGLETLEEFELGNKKYGKESVVAIMM